MIEQQKGASVIRQLDVYDKIDEGYEVWEWVTLEAYGHTLASTPGAKETAAQEFAQLDLKPNRLAQRIVNPALPASPFRLERRNDVRVQAY